MGVPKTPQMVLRHQAVRGFSDEEMAECMDDKSRRRYRRIASGYLHLSPTEAKALEAKFDGLPIHTMFDEGVLTYINGPWPIPRGAGSLKERLERAEAELDALRGDTEPAKEILAPVGLTDKVTIMAVPDEHAEKVVAFLRGLDAS